MRLERKVALVTGAAIVADSGQSAVNVGTLPLALAGS